VKRPQSSGAWISTLAASVAFCTGNFFRSWRDWFQGDVEDGADFAGDAVVPEAIGPIGRNFRVDYGAVRAIFDAADVRAGERQARGEFVGVAFTSTKSLSQL